MDTTNHHHDDHSTGPGPTPATQDASGYAIFADGGVGRAHEMAHRMLDNGSIAEGHRRLGRWLRGRTGSGSRWVHIQFHMAVFELELGLVEDAYARFEEHVLPAAEAGSEALTDAPALAWRLWLALGSPTLFPWEAIRRTAAARIAHRDEPYVDLHNALALAGAGDLAGLGRWFTSRRARARSRVDALVLEVADGLRRFVQGDHDGAAEALSRTLPKIPSIGGSRAQNRLFSQIADACRGRAGIRSSARITGRAGTATERFWKDAA